MQNHTCRLVFFPHEVTDKGLIDCLPSPGFSPGKVEMSVSGKWARLVDLGWMVTSMKTPPFGRAGLKRGPLVSDHCPLFLGRQVPLSRFLNPLHPGFLPTTMTTSDQGSWGSALLTARPGGFGCGTLSCACRYHQHPWHPPRRGQSQPLPGLTNPNCLQTLPTKFLGGQNHPRLRTTGLSLPNCHQTDISAEKRTSLIREERVEEGEREPCRKGEGMIEEEGDWRVGDGGINKSRG